MIVGLTAAAAAAAAAARGLFLAVQLTANTTFVCRATRHTPRATGAPPFPDTLCKPPRLARTHMTKNKIWKFMTPQACFATLGKVKIGRENCRLI